MITPSATSSCCTPVPNCCDKQPAPNQNLKLIDRVCKIAIALFAFYLSPITYAATCTLGLTVGLGVGLYRQFKELAPLPEGEGRPICAQGYMDFLSGIRFPSEMSNIATAVFIGACIRHDPVFYIPFSGFFLGFGAGHEISKSMTPVVNNATLLTQNV